MSTSKATINLINLRNSIHQHRTTLQGDFVVMDGHEVLVSINSEGALRAESLEDSEGRTYALPSVTDLSL